MEGNDKAMESALRRKVQAGYGKRLELIQGVSTNANTFNQATNGRGDFTFLLQVSSRSSTISSTSSNPTDLPLLSGPPLCCSPFSSVISAMKRSLLGRSPVVKGWQPSWLT